MFCLSNSAAAAEDSLLQPKPSDLLERHSGVIKCRHWLLLWWCHELVGSMFTCWLQ